MEVSEGCARRRRHNLRPSQILFIDDIKEARTRLIFFSLVLHSGEMKKQTDAVAKWRCIRRNRKNIQFKLQEGRGRSE